MRVIETTLPDVVIIEPQSYADQRGTFQEIFQAERYSEAGITGDFVQDNLSFSEHGVLRGLHFQSPNSQGKLVYALQGEVFDIAVDVRRGSPHFGQWVGWTLSAKNRHQIWIPEGFAHGFCVTGDSALVAYKCTHYYDAEAEKSIRWDDPEIYVDWPIAQPKISVKDADSSLLRDIDLTLLPIWNK